MPFWEMFLQPATTKKQGYKVFSSIDGKECKQGTYGYVCNIQFGILGSYEDVIRGNIGEDINKPSWCRLEEIK